MTDPVCRYCGPVTGIDSLQQMHEHLQSEEHRQMVQLRYELDAGSYTPTGPENDESPRP